MIVSVITSLLFLFFAFNYQFIILSSILFWIIFDNLWFYFESASFKSKLKNAERLIINNIKIIAVYAPSEK